MSRALVVFAILFGLINVAQAEPARFGAFGGVGYSAYRDTNNNVNANRDAGSVLGASLEAGLSDNWGIESGIQYSDQRYQIPLLARFWIQDTVTAAVGPYLGPRAGENLQEMEVGGMAALGLNFAVNDKSGIFLEGRYLRGFNDYLAASNNTEVIRNDLLALAGIRVDLK